MISAGRVKAHARRAARWVVRVAKTKWLRHLERKEKRGERRLQLLWEYKHAIAAQAFAHEMLDLRIKILLLRVELGLPVVAPRPASIGCKLRSVA